MTTTDALRRSARVAAATAALTVPVLAVAPAWADTPASWESPEPMSTLTALLIFVGIPLALFVGISLLAFAPSLIRGDRRQRGVASWTEPEWFGSDTTRSAKVEGEPAPRELESESSQQGGASARW